ncbi:MAG: ABC transporter permease [Bacteroidia bacterium]|nr:ABC transporter permease [Bacteroidia bacterium]
MRTILIIVAKEFRQLFRNRMMLPIILVMPFVQLVVLAYAADFEIKRLRLWVTDLDQSGLSQRLAAKLEASPNFVVTGAGYSLAAADQAIEADQADLAVSIPAGFERTLIREEEASVQLIANAIDGVRGSLGASYASQIIADFNREVREAYGSSLGLAGLSSPAGTYQLTWSYWYNPKMDYKTFMVPGILALLVTMVGAFLSSMNIVREREIGTIEQINVTPIRKYQFVIGKLLPFWILAIFELCFGLVIGLLLYKIPFLGNFGVLLGFAALYLLLIMGMGLLISTLSENQQQAMFLSWFFMVIFIFLSGMFTAVENMPEWAQAITRLNPLRYFIEAVRMIILKGSGFGDLTQHMWILALYAAVINGLAILRYRKTV